MIIYYYSLDTKKTKNLIYPKPFKSFLNSINIIQNSNEIPKIIASLKDKRSCFLFSIQNTSKENLCHLFESISNIRSSCIIANILVSLDKPCLKKAKDCLEAGACRVIPFTLEPQKLSEEIQSLVKQPIKTRNWLRAFN